MQNERKEWVEKRELDKEILPNYMALLYAIRHGATTDEALRAMGVYDRQRATHANAIEYNPYVVEMDREKGIIRPKKEKRDESKPKRKYTKRKK